VIGNTSNPRGFFVKPHDAKTKKANTSIEIELKPDFLQKNLKSINESNTVYTDWDEYVNPDYILVTLKGGKKLKIAKKSIKGGSRIYQAILAAFNDNNYKITNKIVNSMIDSLNESTRRSKDFFEDDNKYGIELHKLMRGKWDRNKALQYFIKLQSSLKDNSKYQNVLYFIANGLGINGRSYKSIVDLRDDIISTAEQLYKLHNESINEATPIQKIFRKIGWGGDGWTPQDYARQIKDLSDDTLKIWYNLAKSNKGIPNTPLAFQQKLTKIEMEKRGLLETVNEAEEQLDEKLITFSNRAPYGQVVFIAGGAGSGKGFAVSNFLDSAGFKVRDVDEMKKQLQRLNALGKLSIQQIVDRYGKNIKPKDLEIINRIRDAGFDLKTMDLKNPDHVYSLHILVKAMGIKDQSLANMLGAAKNPEVLPNIMFDITAKEIADITDVLPDLMAVGYKPNNIHLVWILTNYEMAIQQNKGRDRVVPADILLQTHIGAGNTIWGLVTKALPKGMNGRVDVVLNNQENTVFYTKRTIDKKTGKRDKAVVSGFLTLPVKKQGGGILTENVWRDILFKWVKDNGPKELTDNM
jgi:hypothetical protein